MASISDNGKKHQFAYSFIRVLYHLAEANEDERNWNDDGAGKRHRQAKGIALSVDQIPSHARAQSMTLSRVSADLTS